MLQCRCSSIVRATESYSVDGVFNSSRRLLSRKKKLANHVSIVAICNRVPHGYQRLKAMQASRLSSAGV